MTCTISPDVARAAVALRRSHPTVPPIDVLDVCMRQRTGSLDDFGPAWAGLLRGVAGDERKRGELLAVWRTHVLPRFAGRFGLG